MGLGLNRTRETVYEQRAQIRYTASLDVSGVNISSINYSASSDKGNISYVFNNGILSVSGLSRGSKYQITAQVTYNYWWSELAGYINGIPQYVTKTGSQTYSKSINIYTHPGPFSMGATSDISSSNSIIHNVLSADKINNEWIPHFQKAYHWYNQSSANYDTSPLQVVSNGLVTATWFNNCMKAMNAIGKNYSTNYSGGANGTIITATLINQMNFSGYA